VHFDSLTPDSAGRSLEKAGICVALSDLRVERREERCLVRLPGERLAWFAASARGVKLMQSERRILRLLAARCGFELPRILFESDDGAFDVRSMVLGGADPMHVYARVRDDPRLAEEMGSALGTMLAEQHSCVHAAEVEG
jgi:hypothetical protein